MPDIIYVITKRGEELMGKEITWKNVDPKIRKIVDGELEKIVQEGKLIKGILDALQKKSLTIPDLMVTLNIKDRNKIEDMVKKLEELRKVEQLKERRSDCYNIHEIIYHYI